jgi:hypothetical protein
LESDRIVKYENMSYDNIPFPFVLNIFQTTFKHRIWEDMRLLLKRQNCHNKQLYIECLTSRPWGSLHTTNISKNMYNWKKSECPKSPLLILIFYVLFITCTWDGVWVTCQESHTQQTVNCNIFKQHILSILSSRTCTHTDLSVTAHW